jgi:hypothetical protein
MSSLRHKRHCRDIVSHVHFHCKTYAFQIVVCPFVLFLVANVLSVLRFTDSYYPFGIFKLFLLGVVVDYPLQMFRKSAVSCVSIHDTLS